VQSVRGGTRSYKLRRCFKPRDASMLKNRVNAGWPWISLRGASVSTSARASS